MTRADYAEHAGIARLDRDSSASTGSAVLAVGKSSFFGDASELNRVVELNSSDVQFGRFYARDPSDQESRAHALLRDAIRHCGHNVVPITVERVAEAGFCSHVVITGNRRLRVCQELKLNVRAIIVECRDREKVRDSFYENERRIGLSSIEKGRLFEKTLTAGVWASIREAARYIGHDHSISAKCLLLARLPTDLVTAFRSPSDLQINWANRLTNACEKNEFAVVNRAIAITQNRGTRTAKDVFRELVQTNGVPSHVQVIKIEKDGRLQAELTVNPRSKASPIVVRIIRSDINVDALEAMLRQILAPVSA